MNITAGTLSKDSGGRYKQTARASVYSNVPVAIEDGGKQPEKKEVASQTYSKVLYKLTFPTHLSGSRINLDPKAHRFEVLTRGNEPAKTFRIIGIKEQSGVVFEVICEKEN